MSACAMDAVLCTHLNSRGVYGAKVLVTVMIRIRVRVAVFDRTVRFLVQGLVDSFASQNRTGRSPLFYSVFILTC